MLDADPRTRGLGKDSAVFQGTAELRGTASHDAQLVARRMAEAIDGVRGVANYMQLAASARLPTTNERPDGRTFSTVEAWQDLLVFLGGYLFGATSAIAVVLRSVTSSGGTTP
jgi:hypothetical protein